MLFLGLTLGGVAVLLALAVAAAVRRRGRIRVPVYPVSAAVTGLLGLGALAALLRADTASAVLPLGVPWIGTHLRIDPLTAVFLTLVNVGACAASLYAVGHGRHEHAHAPAPERVLPFYPAFLAGMNLVVLANDAFSFLLAWEFMSLVSWALVMAQHREPGTAFAGYVYLVMASFGTLALLLAFGLLAGPDGHYDFASIRGAVESPALAGLVLVLALLGAGSKAGLVPLHVWLPLAHAAAPSHVSALMSGVMTKVAVYGFIRIVFDLVQTSAWWWSVVVLVVGAGTAVMGLLYAILQEDLKRLLAYSTVENIGIVFIGLGLALAFRANGLALPAALALTAALFHALNHALFKSLLFFGAGAVLAATGRRDLEALGGLISRMPRTSFACLIGAAAISALPPLNGFVSEWLLFQAILVSPQLPQWGLKFLVPAVGAMLAFAAALAAACFVRAFGIAFLGRPRSAEAAAAQESDAFSTGTMLALALACVLGGVLPGLVVDALAPATRMLVSAELPGQLDQPWLTLVPLSAARSSYNGLIVLAFVAFSTSLVIYAIHALASRAVRRAPPWDCGFPDPRPSTQYTASSFAQPLRRVFGPIVFQAHERVEMPIPGDLRPARLVIVVRDLVWELVYEPIAWGVGRAADRLNRLQFLTIRPYLTLVFAALVSLLVVVALWR